MHILLESEHEEDWRVFRGETIRVGKLQSILPQRLGGDLRVIYYANIQLLSQYLVLETSHNWRNNPFSFWTFPT